MAAARMAGPSPTLARWGYGRAKQEPGTTMLMPIWGRALNAPSASIRHGARSQVRVDVVDSISAICGGTPSTPWAIQPVSPNTLVLWPKIKVAAKSGFNPLP